MNLNKITSPTVSFEKGKLNFTKNQKCRWCVWLFCLFFYTQNPQALWGIGRSCESVFKRNTVLFFNYDFKNPLSKTLIESYWQAHHLQFFANQNKKQIKKIEKGLKKMVEILEQDKEQDQEQKENSTGDVDSLNKKEIKHEHSVSALERVSNTINKTSIETAINKIPQIIELVRKSPPEELLSHRQTVQAVMAFFAKLLPIALKDPNPQQVHWGRIQLILKEIESFNGQDGLSSRFALYKINRAIEKWYSIKEFIKCKI